jgi:hypothetical protein
VRGSPSKEIYETTKQARVVGEQKRKTTKYAFSEYCGILIEVFEIHEWYIIETPQNKIKKRWGFNGKIAITEIREKHINKSLTHTKKKGTPKLIK